MEEIKLTLPERTFDWCNQQKMIDCCFVFQINLPHTLIIRTDRSKGPYTMLICVHVTVSFVIKTMAKISILVNCYCISRLLVL